MDQSTNMKTIGNTTTAIDKHAMHPRVATYRNGYGTHFQCTSTCYLIMWTYLACVVALLALLAVIPVQAPTKSENAPFALWMENNPPSESDDGMIVKKKKKKTLQRTYGLMDRLSMWFYGYHEPIESSESEEESKSFHHDIDLVTDNIEPKKTFESIGVETDDSLLPPPPKEIVFVEAPAVPEPVHEKKPGIFAPIVRTEDNEGNDLPDRGGEPSRRGSILPRRQESVVGGIARRRSSAAGVPPPEVSQDELLAEVERRTSMQKRAEKRKEYAKSDIAHDNLHEHELYMYEYLEFVRSLLEGVSLKKITQKSGKVVKRTFFITPDLTTVHWNQVGNRTWVSKKSSIDCTEINHVTKGAAGDSSRVKSAKQDLCVSIVMNNGKRLVLEAKDDTMCERLFLGFSRLAFEKKEEKRKREAGEVDEEQQQAQESDTRRQAEQNLDKKKEAAATSDDDAPDQVPSEEAERQAKSDEDDPQRWRNEPEADDHGNQSNEAAIVISEDEEKESEEVDLEQDD